MSELQAHHCMTTKQWTWLLRSVAYRQIYGYCKNQINQSE